MRSADRAARVVMARIASPLRHELAGALLVPQMQLQMLQSRLAAAEDPLDATELAASVAEVLDSLEALRTLHQKIIGWLLGEEARPRALDDCVRKLLSVLTLPFAVSGLELSLAEDDDTPLSTLIYPAQPLSLMVVAAFFAVQDALTEVRGRVRVAAGDDGGAGWVEWRFEASDEVPPVLDRVAPEVRLDVEGLAALATRHGMRFIATPPRWRLDLGVAPPTLL